MHTSFLFFNIIKTFFVYKLIFKKGFLARVFSKVPEITVGGRLRRVFRKHGGWEGGVILFYHIFISVC